MRLLRPQKLTCCSDLGVLFAACTSFSAELQSELLFQQKRQRPKVRPEK